MRTREEVLKLWSDTELCPDFSPVLNEILDDREKLQLKVGEERREAFHAGYQGGKDTVKCQHPYKYIREIKTHQPPFSERHCEICGSKL